MLSTQERAEIESMIASIYAVYGDRELDDNAKLHMSALRDQIREDDAKRAARRDKRAINQSVRLETASE